MSEKPDRDVEKTYSNAEFVDKLRRLADAIENDEKFEIQIDNDTRRHARASLNLLHQIIFSST